MIYVYSLLIFGVYVQCQYNAEIREKWLWLLGPLFALLAHGAFSLYIRHLDQTATYKAAFWFWDVCAHLPFMVLPLLFFDVKLTPLGIIGVALVGIGVVLFHFGTQ